ncbi:exopolysaccharide biosynthesis polyprenyl glycosylphosphotransferase [uncultured Ilyobacter sp.]|uniref:exopolysaccharide biosynthesis polyprenyl glycosylphosphotransferase n=1 Tax=uncultured Ilyobacter sp. TaxID=544433 RepID=UPI0029C07992|nr:exopolysaccharide biosynthesis polyprenyl glycosylphosphotransferase [uncultured Ilyobacter sp.]
MKTNHVIYFNIIYLVILYSLFYIGNAFFGTPMKSYSYVTFLMVYFYYYLIDFLTFENPVERYRPWITSSGIHIALSVLLWSFSKSRLLFFKFFIFWFFSNIVIEIMVKFAKHEIKAIFIGKQEDLERCLSERKNIFFNFIKRLDNFDGINIFKYAEENNIEAVVVKEKISNFHQKEFLQLKLRGIEVLFIWQYKEEIEKKIDVKNISDKWFLHSSGFTILSDSFEKKIKKIADMVTAILIGVFTLPIMLISAIIIKLESPGPIFYCQNRVGLGGEEFKLIKFRSMKPDAEKDGPQWSSKNDSRITRYGAFMRKSRIDELPQLWNVLKGEMSFIGPRPERGVFIKHLEKELPYYNMRHLVKPGITGWAQVMYPYGASVEDSLRKLEYDLYYIKHQRITFDILIFFKTINIILFGKGR